jgi:hypothetical protein
VAKLPDSVLTNIFTLQRQIIECIDATTAMHFKLLAQEGETDETLSELEELQSIRERLLSPYSRLHTLALKTAESQPVASNDVLNLSESGVKTPPFKAALPERTLVRQYAL